MTLCVRCGRPAISLVFETTEKEGVVGLCYTHARYALWDDIREALAEKGEKDCGI